MATGKYAFGMCDICGRKFPLHELRTQWNGLKACSVDFDIKHSQLEPKKRTTDNIAVEGVRPDRDADGDYTDEVQLSTVITMHFGNDGLP